MWCICNSKIRMVLMCLLLVVTLPSLSYGYPSTLHRVDELTITTEIEQTTTPFSEVIKDDEIGKLRYQSTNGKTINLTQFSFTNTVLSEPLVDDDLTDSNPNDVMLNDAPTEEPSTTTNNPTTDISDESLNESDISESPKSNENENVSEESVEKTKDDVWDSYVKGPLIIIAFISLVSLCLFFMYIYKFRSLRAPWNSQT